MRLGQVRGDTVHQGDRYGEKGVYHNNAVDEVTQYEYTGVGFRILSAPERRLF